MDILARAVRQEKERVFKKKERKSNCMFEDDMIIYLENPNVSAQNLKLISNLSNSQHTKSMCENHKHSHTPMIESQIMSELPFTTAIKRIKYLGI